MKKYYKYILIVLLIIFIKLFTSYVINQKIIKDYNNDKYDTGTIKLLYFLNINEPYIVYYNEGNLYFKNGNYKSAINNYKKSLKRFPPKRRVCDIRINLSLAMIYNIDSDSKDATSILNEAKNNLYENDCAHKEDDNGRSQDAEKLEHEIDKLLNSGGNGGNQGDPQEKPDDPQEDPEQAIRDRNKDARQKRGNDLERGKDIDNGTPNNGKRW